MYSWVSSSNSRISKFFKKNYFQSFKIKIDLPWSTRTPGRDYSDFLRRAFEGQGNNLEYKNNNKMINTLDNYQSKLKKNLSYYL